MVPCAGVKHHKSDTDRVNGHITIVSGARHAISLMERCIPCTSGKLILRAKFNRPEMSGKVFLASWKDWTSYYGYLFSLGAPKDLMTKNTRPPKTPCPFTSGTEAFLRSLIARSFAVNNRNTIKERRTASRIFASLLQAKRAFPPLSAEIIAEALEEHSRILSTPPISNSADPVPWILENYFPVGWAKGTVSSTVSLNNRSVLEGGTCRDPYRECTDEAVDGPVRLGAGYVLARRHYQSAFDKCYCACDNFDVKAVGVQDAGKIRVITKSSKNLKVLSVLQKALHKHLKTFPEFALTSRPLEHRELPAESCSISVDLQQLGDRTLGPILSVDYKSATDLLHGDFQERLISEVIDRSGSFELMTLKEIAKSELRLGRRILYPDRSAYQRRGMLMGSLLSFPILCLVNAFVIRRITKNSFLVNGDDAAFRATQDEREKWEMFASEIGLQPSQGKVYHSHDFVTLCSSYYREDRNGRFKKIEHVPFGIFQSTINGDDFNSLPKIYRRVELYKRYCRMVPTDCRPLIGPRCFGGLGGIDEKVDPQDEDFLWGLKKFNLRMRPIPVMREPIRSTQRLSRLRSFMTWFVPAKGFLDRTPQQQRSYYPVSGRRLRSLRNKHRVNERIALKPGTWNRTSATYEW